jgi:hypothetical protein
MRDRLLHLLMPSIVLATFAGSAHALCPLEHGGRPGPGLRVHGPRRGFPEREVLGAARASRTR